MYYYSWCMASSFHICDLWWVKERKSQEQEGLLTWGYLLFWHTCQGLLLLPGPHTRWMIIVGGNKGPTNTTKLPNFFFLSFFLKLA
jgi:hypothetical protein